MTKTTAPTKTQARALEILAPAGELELWAWRSAGANLNAIDALLRKGLVTMERRTHQDPRFFGGQEYQGAFYRVA